VNFKTTGSVGDADIYVKIGSAPTTSSYTKVSDGNTDNESITFTSPKAGTYYLLLESYKSFSGVTLTATIK
jgi:pseudomonalisin/xanthomonalisin